jgi:hypothetical protein
MKYTSNDIFNQNINLKLDNFSISEKNYKNKKYPHLLTINNLSTNQNIYPTNQEYNSMKNSPLTKRRINSTNNNYIFDNNENLSNNKNYSISEIKKMNHIKYLNHRLTRKGLALNNTDDNNIYNDNCNINTNNNIYNIKAKPSLRYLSNYNLNDILIKTNESEYSQFNNTQINPKNLYLNEKLDFNEIYINDNSLEGSFQYRYDNKKNNKIYQKTKRKNKISKNLFPQENNRSIIHNNINNNIMNNYINIKIDKYNSKKLINMKNSQIKSSRLRKKMQNESIENYNYDSGNLLIKLINSKIYKRQRTLGSKNLNNKKIYQNIRQKGKPLSFLSSKYINNERSEYY